MRFKNKEAVSPVIGVILMVAITVILAAVVYIWVLTIMPTGKGTPTVSYTTSGYEDGFMVNIETVTIRQSVKYIKYVLIDENGNTVETGYVDKIYSNWSAKGVMFVDNNYNNPDLAARLAGGSIFKIEQTGGSHGGVAKTGYQFGLIDTSTDTATALFRASL